MPRSRRSPPLPVVLGLDHLDATARSFLGRALGDGEVSLRREADGGRCAARAQETALAGVWIDAESARRRRQRQRGAEIAAAPSIAFGVWSKGRRAGGGARCGCRTRRRC